MRNRDNPSEAALVEQAKDSCAEAFAELAVRARPLCLTVARSILGDDAEAEDQVQNAFLKAWRNIDQFRYDASFSSWMCRIVTNECLMVVRKRSRVQHLSLDESSVGDSPLQIVVRDGRANPEQLVGREEIGELLSRELRRVPKIFRTVLVMVEVHGLSIDEIAERLGISAAATKSRLMRARRALRTRVEAHTGRMGLATLLSQ
jgi:RNA polymerase sigma-70 factor (ECF subfamily)